MRLSDFDVLSFDCYGTLIDWETGLRAALAPVLARSGVVTPDRALETFAHVEAAQQAATPTMAYHDVLATVHARLARHWNLAPSTAADRRFADSVASWPPFPDTIAALRALQHDAKLVILSNVDRASFAHTQVRLGVAFFAVFTAEDIGSYKPDPRNFTYLIDRLAGCRILHVAQSLFHDHVAANAAGLATVWIDRRHAAAGWGATPPPQNPVQPDFQFPTLTALVAARDAERKGDLDHGSTGSNLNATPLMQ